MTSLLKMTATATQIDSTTPTTRPMRYEERPTGLLRMSCNVPDENSGPMSWQPAMSAKRAINSYGPCVAAPMAVIITTITMRTSNAEM